MEICKAIDDLKATLWGKPGLVLVPTMGALHRGHFALIEEARRCAGKSGTVLVSIFVNPTQFGAGEDFTRYPSRPAEDKAHCEEAGVDILFEPEAGEMYAADASIKVMESRLSSHLCGRSRPGHFPAVCTVVLKLFNIARPDIAVFGCKDYQQLAILRRLVRDLNLDVEIVGVPTVRDQDGVAVSSRNLNLTGEERYQAAVIAKALFAVQTETVKGERDAAILIEMARAIIAKSPLAKIDYAEVVDPDDLQPVRRIDKRAVFAVAVFLGKNRLIDNIELVPPAEG
ncbi:MAG: pantoate--beta-alanine ligase [Verrucomicrobiales bacterium]